MAISEISTKENWLQTSTLTESRRCEIIKRQKFSNELILQIWDSLTPPLKETIIRTQENLSIEFLVDQLESLISKPPLVVALLERRQVPLAVIEKNWNVWLSHNEIIYCVLAYQGCLTIAFLKSVWHTIQTFHHIAIPANALLDKKLLNQLWDLLDPAEQTARAVLIKRQLKSDWTSLVAHLFCLTETELQMVAEDFNFVLGLPNANLIPMLVSKSKSVRDGTLVSLRKFNIAEVVK